MMLLYALFIEFNDTSQMFHLRLILMHFTHEVSFNFLTFYKIKLTLIFNNWTKTLQTDQFLREHFPDHEKHYIVSYRVISFKNTLESNLENSCRLIFAPSFIMLRKYFPASSDSHQFSPYNSSIFFSNSAALTAANK